MRTNAKASTSHIAKFVLFSLIIFFLQSCVAMTTPARRIEGSEFKKNLPGLWEGNWYLAGRSGKKRINIIEIDGNKVGLTGYSSGGDHWAGTDDVHGRIENSTLFLTWPGAGLNGVIDRFTMIQDDSNNLILDGNWRSPDLFGTSQLQKIH